MGRPLIDWRLVAADHVLGLHVPDIISWVSRHPWADRLLGMSYDTLLAQTAAVVIVLGLCGDRRQLETFVLRFMFAALVMLGIFMLFPAEGPFAAYGYEPSASQARYLEHLHALRAGTMHTITYSEAEGLITFPSFHTAWAVLLALALLFRLLVRQPLSWRDVLIASTITTILLIAGTFALGIYFDRFGSFSVSGVAASLLVILFWLYYLAQIMIGGAELLKVLDRRARHLPAN